MSHKIGVAMVIVSASMVLASAAQADTYKCWRFIDGKATGAYIKINADNTTDAVSKALAESRKMVTRGPRRSANKLFRWPMRPNSGRADYRPRLGSSPI